MYIYFHAHARLSYGCPQKLEEGIGSSGATGTDDYDMICRFWHLNVDPLEE